jgi:hypothetical protein
VAERIAAAVSVNSTTNPATLARSRLACRDSAVAVNSLNARQREQLPDALPHAAGAML